MQLSTFSVWILLLCSELILSNVFVERLKAVQLLGATTRRRRANSQLLEEVLPGNLERECYEEVCSEEEAAEIFQTREKTLEFWFRYKSLNRCRTNPCLNGGLCTMDQGRFLCLCPPQFHGLTCQKVVLECSYRNGGCLQYCRDLPGGAGVQCGCAAGYRLEEDGHSCSSTVSFPCGRQQNLDWISTRSLSIQDENPTTESNSTDRWVPEHNTTRTRGSVNATETEWFPNATQRATQGSVNATRTDLAEEEEEEVDVRIVGGVLEKQGGSPWQVLIRRADGYGFCGGTLVSERWVVSAAHCFEETADHVTVGDYDKQRPDPGEQQVKVQKVVLHPHFHLFTYDSDIALLYLSQPVLFSAVAVPVCLPDLHLSHYLLKENLRGVVSGWGTTQYLGRSSRFLRKVSLPVVSHQTCRKSTEQIITDNMFCAGFPDASRDSCSGDSGGPFVVNYRGTWFLGGVVSWGEECARRGKYGVYTRLGNFLSWIRDTMENEGRDQEQNKNQHQDQNQNLDQN